MTDTVEIDLDVVQDTPLAFLCSNGDADNLFWLRKADVESERVAGDIHTFMMPEWLAKERGLI